MFDIKKQNDVGTWVLCGSTNTLEGARSTALKIARACKILDSNLNELEIVQPLAFDEVWTRLCEGLPAPTPLSAKQWLGSAYDAHDDLYTLIFNAGFEAEILKRIKNS